MRKTGLYVLAVLSVAALACARSDDTDADTDAVPGAETTPPAATAPEGVTAPVVVSRADFEKSADAGAMDVKGYAELRRTGTMADAPLELNVRLEGLKASHAWHIHSGNCSVKDAPVAIPLSPPLTAGADGTVETTVPIPAGQLTDQQLSTQEYSVHVHTNAGDPPGASIACANIKKT
jgi:hypothetical protein